MLINLTSIIYLQKFIKQFIFKGDTLFFSKSSKIASIIIAIALSTQFVGCSKSQDSIQISKQGDSHSIGIINTPKTSLRLQPFIFSARIGELTKGSTFEVLQRSKKKAWIAGKRNYWYKIKLKNLIEGWTYGNNITIFSDSSSDAVNDKITKFWEKEKGILNKLLIGRWWSFNRFNDFTRYGLDIRPDNKYISYYKGRQEKAKEGTYEIDMANSILKFKGYTTFKGDLHFKKFGKNYYLIAKEEKNPTRFKRILEDFKKDKQIKKDEIKTK